MELSEFTAIAAIAVTLGIAIVAGAVGYGRLQGRLAELGRDVGELKADNKTLHDRISARSEEYNSLREEIIRLQEGQKHLADLIAKTGSRV